MHIHSQGFTQNITTIEKIMDNIDKQLLDIIQTGFPIHSRPYEVLGQSLGITEAEALARVRALKEAKIIRRLGANFQSSKLGFRSTLCAAKVPEGQIQSFVEHVNTYNQVTHNYLREHLYNVWFTFIGSSWDEVTGTLAQITKKTGVEILNLPATKLFKIRVDFKMDKEKNN